MKAKLNHLKLSENSIERFIPISKQDIITDLLANAQWIPEQRQQFADFCNLVTALYHYKFHNYLENLKNYYRPFNPDTDTIACQYSVEEQQQRYNQFIKEIHQLLNHANYEPLSVNDINQAMTADSYYGVKVSVDWDDFAEIIIYYRDFSTLVKLKRTWSSLFLRTNQSEITIYKKLFLLLKFKTMPERIREWVAINGNHLEKQAQKRIRQARQAWPTNMNEEHIFIKLFKDIPLSDLEMLFPNQQVRFKLFDKIKLGVTGGGGTIAGIISVISKAGLIFTSPITFIAAFLGFIGIIFRQIMGFFNQRTRYMMKLSQNLYFLNLDNNLGVINYLVDMAEEEECKEAVLAYYFLYIHADKNYTKEKLDQAIENYLHHQYGVVVNFEIEDGLRKLRQEGLLNEVEGILTVVDLPQACLLLDKKWDDCFVPTQPMQIL
ncbi:hypothetical protein THII_0218 [Thioploca ingrica]|uniref:DUF3754 domain-containing protein n=1 Tax=Thioploca ingrica TaxID=40754 RepID=A0A090AI90_9GAMM|nr:hypothetical protein THII_0218 [Thioploca ingrica]